MPKIKIKNREKLILCALFLSKFDKRAYEALGFVSFLEAFNTLALALQGKASNIKNYRDEFDPYFDNNRKGWHQRAMRAYVKEVFDKYKNLDFESFKSLISTFLIENYEKKLELSEFLDFKLESSYIKRIATGKAAEQYFKENFAKDFDNFEFFDSRNLGCGFDFKLQNLKEFICVEVKGLSENAGNFLLSQKEYEIAQKLKDKYCLYIVSNLKEKPKSNLFFNPLKHFDLKEQSTELKSYQGSFNV